MGLGTASAVKGACRLAHYYNINNHTLTGQGQPHVFLALRP